MRLCYQGSRLHPYFVATVQPSEAVGLSFGLSLWMGMPYVFDPGITLIAFVFSALVGVVFGYFPARRAARLNPIDALRTL